MINHIGKENILLVLWVLLGFLLVTAINSLLYSLIHLIYFGLYELGISYRILTIAIPFITFLFYAIITYILLARTDIKAKTSGIYLIKFPRKLAVTALIIALGLKPITKKLADFHRDYSLGYENSSRHEFLDFYSWLQVGFGISRSLIILILLIVLLPKLRNFKSKRCPDEIAYEVKTTHKE